MPPILCQVSSMLDISSEYSLKSLHLKKGFISFDQVQDQFFSIPNSTFTYRLVFYYRKSTTHLPLARCLSIYSTTGPSENLLISHSTRHNGCYSSFEHRTTNEQHHEAMFFLVRLLAYQQEIVPNLGFNFRSIWILWLGLQKQSPLSSIRIHLRLPSQPHLLLNFWCSSIKNSLRPPLWAKRGYSTCHFLNRKTSDFPINLIDLA